MLALNYLNQIITMSTIHQRKINTFFSKRSILYQPGLGIILGSVNAGIFISQLLYWHELGSRKDGWIYKTMDEFRIETGLSRTQQENAIKKCLEVGFIDYKLAGIPAKRHFKINFEHMLNSLPSMKKKFGLTYPNPPTKNVENLQSNTKSTHQTTSYNTNRSKSNNLLSIQEIINNKRENIS